MAEDNDVDMLDVDDEVKESGPADAVLKDAKAITVGGETVLPWVEKYRPQTLTDIAAHQDIISTIQRFIEQNRLPHLLFHGPPGTGKTSTILACAKGMFGKKFGTMVLELNASDARGIDVVREQIRSFVSARQLFSTGVKLVVLDEADNMTSAAQFALRRIMEQYSSNARFCMICNYVNKVIPALQSRCTKFRFGPLGDKDVRDRVGQIARAENLELSPGGMDTLLRLGGGDMRRVLNILQSASMAFPKVDEHALFLTTGTPLPSDLDTCLNTLLTKNVQDAFKQLDTLRHQKGYALVDLVRGIHERAAKVKWPPRALVVIMPRLADIEYRLSLGCSEKVQMGALVGAFQEARAVIEQIKRATPTPMDQN